MDHTVLFRDFEERDIDFVYRCKNDEKLNSLIVGDFRTFSYEDATKWVHGCMGHYDEFKFWAICSNDSEKRIIGWVSLSQINTNDKSAFFHGIVIGDSAYRNGFAWIEAYLFIYEFVFEHLKFKSLYGSAREDHSSTLAIRKVMFHREINTKKETVNINGRICNVSYSILQDSDYFEHKKNGDYTLPAIVRRMRKVILDGKHNK